MTGVLHAVETVRAAAIAYARMGWEIMPRRAVADETKLIDALDGTPRMGLRRPEQVESYWAAFPATPALAAVCGPHSGLLILDVDQHESGPDGLAELRKLEERQGRLPPTPLVLSPSGAGRHLYFRWRTTPIRTCAIVPGVEVLGDRAAANLPPSMKRERPYLWSLDQHPDYLPIADAPAWLVEMAAGTASRGPG